MVLLIPALVPIGISLVTSVISTSGGRVKFISKIDVFIAVS
jgi:hypothetical protein